MRYKGVVARIIESKNHVNVQILDLDSGKYFPYYTNKRPDVKIDERLDFNLDPTFTRVTEFKKVKLCVL